MSKDKSPVLLNNCPKFADLVQDTGKWGVFTTYPDGSRQFNDIISVIGMVTADGSPLVSMLSNFLLSYWSGINKLSFDDGLLTPMHQHNYIELGYVAEGQFKQHIEGGDYIFNKGEMFLINKDVRHGEYLYRKNMAVLFLNISNTFFDKSMNHTDLAGKESEVFFKSFITATNRDYCFVRCVPKGEEDAERIPGLFDGILTELWKPQAGSSNIVIGLVKRLISLIPLEYTLSVEMSSRNAFGKRLFEEVRTFLEEHYRDVSIGDLIAAFGRNTDYFNRLVKRHTGMTYSVFLQSIRLDKAEFLLKNTGLTVEEIALQVGYEDPAYFYKIFRKRFNKKPGDMRNAAKDRITPE